MTGPQNGHWSQSRVKSFLQDPINMLVKTTTCVSRPKKKLCMWHLRLPLRWIAAEHVFRLPVPKASGLSNPSRGFGLLHAKSGVCSYVRREDSWDKSLFIPAGGSVQRSSLCGKPCRFQRAVAGETQALSFDIGQKARLIFGFRQSCSLKAWACIWRIWVAGRWRGSYCCVVFAQEVAHAPSLCAPNDNYGSRALCTSVVPGK